MLFKNRLEKLMFNDRYNLKHKGIVRNNTYECIYDVPGEFYKSMFIGNSSGITGPCTLWLLAIKTEGVGIQPYVEIREAVLSGDESCWYCKGQALARLYTPDEVKLFMNNYKKEYQAAHQIKRF